MKCNCGYTTDNKKSFSNHIRFGCPIKRPMGLFCRECGMELIRKWNGGHQSTSFCNQKCYGEWISKHRRGERASNYVHGKCNENLLFRASREYKQWRLLVFKRDNFTCVLCDDSSGGNLEADHIKSFALHPKLRLEISNGRTLCKKCHKQTNNYGFKKSNSKTEDKIQDLG